jgi:tetratricopeptide (TPR) repeat protein
MKRLILFALLIANFCAAQAQLNLPPSGDNQKSVVTQFIGLVAVTITYNSPNVHSPSGEDRTGHIWGELVHYGFIDQGYGSSKAAPWRAGANENTTISFSHDVVIDGKTLNAGAYGLFLDVEKEGPWTWIFSHDANNWGSYFYDQSKDALRVAAYPQESSFTEWLAYGFDDRLANATMAYLQWENKRVSFNIEVPDINELYVESLRHQLNGTTAGFTYHTYMAAAQFCAQNKINLEEALTWADLAISQSFFGREDFSSLQTKALVLLAMNKEQEADAIMDKAIKHPTASVGAVHQYARGLLSSGKTQKAMDVFLLNRKLHPEDTFTTYVGLARGYTAMGDKKNAIKNWEIAIKNLPEDQKGNISYYQSELSKVKG